MEGSEIIYILIAKNKKVLCDYSENKGDFIYECQNRLNKIKKNNLVSINMSNGYIIYYLNENDITYEAFVTDKFPKATIVGCLESIKSEFQNAYMGRDFEGEEEYGLNEEFREKLKMKMDYYNEHQEVSSETIQNIKEEMEKMKTEIIEADKLLNIRGEKMNNLNKKAQDLADDSKKMVKLSKTVKKGECMKKHGLKIWILIALLVICYAITCIVCRSFVFDCSSD